MFKKFSLFLLVILSLSFCVVQAKTEKLLVSGCGWPQISILDKKTGEILWKHALNPGEDCNDVELTKEGNILYAYTKGARMIDRKEKVLWDFTVKPGEELYTATQLKNGNYFLAMCGKPARFVVLDKTGKQLKEFTYDTGIEGVHGQLRQVYPTEKNTVLIALLGKGEVVEIDHEGKLLGTYPAKGNPFGIVPLKAGGPWLAACGDGGCIVEIDPKKKEITKTYDSSMTAPHKFLFVAEIRTLKNGNLLVANWHGHSADKTQPSVMEFNPKTEKVVWVLPRQEGHGDISTVFAFEE